MVDLSFQNSSYSFIIKLLHTLFMSSADSIIVTSNAMKHDFIKRKIQKSKISLVHNPVDIIKIRNVISLKRFKGKGLRFVTVGRLVFQKGIDRIIPIIKNIENCHLTIIGEGSEKNHLEKLIANNNIKNKIQFTGFINYYNSYVAAADYFLLPSRWEGLPNSALESLILGTPVLSFKEIVGLNDFISMVPKDKIILFKDEIEMQKYLIDSMPRSDWKQPIIREPLLKSFNDPTNYAKKIENIIKGIVDG